VLCGIHDSSANFYRYEAAGLRDLTVISTGTWIVGLSDRFDGALLREDRGMTCNADVAGRPLAGILTMGGREFEMLAGDARQAQTDPRAVARVIEAGTMALPSFGADDALFPGTRQKGRIIGKAPGDATGRRALAILHVALLTDLCLDRLGGTDLAVLNGSFVTDPLYPSLVAALRPAQRVLTSAEPYGTGAGAAMLAGHAARRSPETVALDPPAPLRHAGLARHRDRWRDLAERHCAECASAVQG
jgi:hypothetical protein